MASITKPNGDVLKMSSKVRCVNFCAHELCVRGGETSSYSENWMHVFRIRPRELAYLGNPSFQTSLLYQPTFFSTETWSLNFFCELALISKPTLWQLINFRAKCLDHFFVGTAHAYRVSSWMDLPEESNKFVCTR